MRLMIGEALALTASYRCDSAVSVIVPKRGTVIVAEAESRTLKLCQHVMKAQAAYRQKRTQRSAVRLRPWQMLCKDGKSPRRHSGRGNTDRHRGGVDNKVA